MIPGVVSLPRRGEPPVPADNFMAAVLAMSPWGYWRLDEDASDPIPLDSSGNGRHALSSGVTTKGLPGLFGGSAGAYGFNPGYIPLPNFPVTSTGAGFSILLAVKNSSTGIRQLLSADAASYLRAWQFRINGSNLEFITIQAPTSTTAVPVSLMDGAPHMIVLSFSPDVAAADGRAKMYVDGVLVAQSTASHTMPTGDAVPGIGSRSGASGQDSSADVMDEVALFDRAVSAVEVANLWAKRNDA